MDREGCVDWCCFGRFDGRPVFARLLDLEKGGFFRVAPIGKFWTERRYLPGTNVIETRFEAAGGVLELTDCLPIGLERQESLVRRLRSIAGEVEVELVFAPRFDYGLTVPQIELAGEGLVSAFGGADALLLHADWPVQVERGSAYGRCVLRAGEERWVAVEWAPSRRIPPRIVPRPVMRERLEETVAWWQRWSSRCTWRGPRRESVVRSALVLKGLTYAPTGAIAAACTTSLPESIGGVRNWDYRYCWLRDSVVLLTALLTLGYKREGIAYARWLTRTTAGDPRDLQIMYGLGGERLLFESTLPWLSGYRGSSPVRIGNGAWTQLQLDIWGELLGAVWILLRQHLPSGFARPTPGAREFIAGLVETVADRWCEPDDGGWEFRATRRHFVFSKLMCWVGIDRGIALLRALGEKADLARLEGIRDSLRRLIEDHGVDPETGGFVQAFASKAADASTLQLLLRGFLPPDDPRIQATIADVERRLVKNGLVYRYLGDDGLPGSEGAFVYCSLWLAACYALSGRIDEAEAQFERVLSCANDLGLLSEEVDPESGELLGNFPQAFSHAGVIETAFLIEQARRGALGAARG